MGKALNNYADWRLRESLRDYDFYFQQFKQMITNMFIWENLPDNISQRFLEEHLFNEGMVLFFKSSDLDIHVVSKALTIGLNDYEEPTLYHALGVNRINEVLSPTECVPIWNTNFRKGSVDTVHFFAKRLSGIEKTIDVNLEQLKNPSIIACPEGQRETVKQIIKEKSDGVPYIFTSDDFDGMVKVNVFDMHVQNHTRELEEIRMSKEHQALTYFGINNVNILKKERLISGEAEQNNEQISINRNAMYQSRLRACKEINEMFGLNVNVRYNAEICEVFGYDE